MQLVAWGCTVDIGDQEDLSLTEIDDWSARDSNVRTVIPAAKGRWHRRAEVAAQQNGARVGVESIDGIVFSHDVEHIMCAPRNLLGGNQQRLGVDLIIKRDGSKHAESRRKRRGVEQRFILVPAGAQIVIV